MKDLPLFEISEEIATQIIFNADLDGNWKKEFGKPKEVSDLNYWDFLMAILDTGDKNNFFTYCKNAYDLLFRETMGEALPNE